jgi:diamine N-acetyltransferase
MTPQITLRKIDENNWRQVYKLKVAPEQQHFVAPNGYSLSEAAYSDCAGHLYPWAIYDGETLVGFAMYEDNKSPDTKERDVYFICRLMVDAAQQGKGYGRAAMLQLLDKIKAEPDCKQIGISYEPENEVARKLYLSLGFVETGEIVDGETVAIYTPE